MGSGTGPGLGMGSMGSDTLCRNVHTGLRLIQGSGPIVTYSAGPILCTYPDPGLVASVNKAYDLTSVCIVCITERSE